MSRAGRRTRRSAPRHDGIRGRLVWGALAASMTLVGGTLWALQGAPAPRLDGLAIPALVAAGGPANIESAVRTRAPIDRARWTSIVIHHTGSVHADPASLEAQHKAMSLHGLGYHFIIGNGSGMADGEVHVGYRWLDQLPGAHVAGPRGDHYNRTSIGICLVGDGRRRPFTAEQMDRLVELVQELSDRLGIPPGKVHLHSELAGTEDPGRFFPSAAFREQIGAN